MRARRGTWLAVAGLIGVLAGLVGTGVAPSPSYAQTPTCADRCQQELTNCLRFCPPGRNHCSVACFTARADCLGECG